jgi:hypothetical protein
MNLDLTDDETAALRALLRQTIEGDRFPLVPRLRPYKALLAKFDPPPPQRAPLPPPKAPGTPSILLRKKRRR